MDALSIQLPDNERQEVLFISDLHLDPSSPGTIVCAIDFLSQAHSAKALFIIGDLFEYWLGDDAADPRLQTVYDALRAVSNDGTAIHIMHGNRDFLLGDAFGERVGADVHCADHIMLNTHNKCFSLLHGDTLCTDDADYQQLRTLLRSKDWQQDFLSGSIDERIAKAQALREKSKEAVADKVANIMDVNVDAVLNHCSAHPSDCLIHGHTHRPAEHRLPGPTPRRIVLGDWHEDHAMFARFDGETLRLETFRP